MTGPVFRCAHVEDYVPEEGTLPREYNGKRFIAEYNRNWLKTVEYNENGEVVEIEDFMPDAEFEPLQHLELDPDRTLYVLEYSEGGRGGSISRIEHIGEGEQGRDDTGSADD